MERGSCLTDFIFHGRSFSIRRVCDRGSDISLSYRRFSPAAAETVATGLVLNPFRVHNARHLFLSFFPLGFLMVYMKRGYVQIFVGEAV
jgi:hypothetical protein